MVQVYDAHHHEAAKNPLIKQRFVQILIEQAAVRNERHAVLRFGGT